MFITTDMCAVFSCTASQEQKSGDARPLCVDGRALGNPVKKISILVAIQRLPNESTCTAEPQTFM